MSERIEHLLNQINGLQNELQAEKADIAAKFRYSAENRKIIFEQDIAAYHRRLRQNLWQLFRSIPMPILMTTPVIYSMLFPLFVLDVFVTIYQAVCFPVYGIKKVLRADFITIDREYLQYLNIFERINCSYCGYATGLISYVREITARTENYWCPIKHAHRILQAHSLYAGFEEYGDAEGYRARMRRLIVEK